MEINSKPYLLLYYGVPCSVLGVGMQKAHTTEEYIIEEDLYTTAAWVLQIVKDAAQAK